MAARKKTDEAGGALCQVQYAGCEGPMRPGKVSCQSCADTKKRKTHERALRGLCACGKQTRSGLKTCQACHDNALTNIRKNRLKDKLEVFALLGNKCACTGVGCWHDGPCVVTDYRALSVHHTDGKGCEHRKNGTEKQAVGSALWRLYLESIKGGNVELKALCLNCHSVETAETASEHLRKLRRKTKYEESD